MRVNVPFGSFRPMERELDEALRAAFARVFENSWYIAGQEGQVFEHSFADYCGADYCVGCGCGLDALRLLLEASGIGAGDEVLLPSNAFIGAALAISAAGAVPVPVEPRLDTYTLDPEKLEGRIGPAAKAVLVAHQYGQPAEMEPIVTIARRHGLRVFEDATQAHGAWYRDKRVGSLADGAAFSFYPGKNLGALGDAGCMVTDDPELARRARILAGYGRDQKDHHICRGWNSRLDELQAAFLTVKLPHLDRWNQERSRIAARYLAEIANPAVILPRVARDCRPVWHVFAVRCKQKAALKAFLAQQGVQCGEHYPVPIHLQEAYAELGLKKGSLPLAEEIGATELSLPIFYGMTEEQVEAVIGAVNAFVPPPAETV